MRLLAFNHNGKPALGLRLGQEVVNLTAEGLPATLDELLRAGPEALAAAKKAGDSARTRLPLAGIDWLPPVQSPAKAIAVGLNYVDHAAESKFDPPTYPVLFHRFPSSWVGHNQPIVRPHVSTQFDYEGELLVVIGKAGRYIKKADALNHVAGYSVFNDGSLRDYQFKSAQWMMGKNFDRSGAFGPEFVTADELPAGATGLKLQTRLNGTVLQDANTRDMIFDVATLVSVCSEPFALQPGDMIIAGTPSGVGLARKPPVWMKAGAPPVRIGSTLALTGPLSATALTHKLVGEIYVEQLNKRGGLLGRRVEWIVKDDQSKPDLARTLYEQLVTSDKVDLLMGPYATGAILSAMGVAQRYNKVLVHHTFGIPSLAKYDMQFPAWSLGPDPQNTVSNSLFDMLATAKKPPKTIAIVTSKFPSIHFMSLGGREVAKKRGLQGSAVPRMGLRQPRLRPDRRAGEGRQSRPGVDRRHRPGRQHAAGRDEEDRLRAAAALPPVPGAGPDDQVARRANALAVTIFEEHPPFTNPASRRNSSRPSTSARPPPACPTRTWKCRPRRPSPPGRSWKPACAAPTASTTRRSPSSCARTRSTPSRAGCASTARATTATT
jgi:2-keto-4-pentenoate hydratase/2-oxohepta-3-ene-1,7-dioic acid hydratase in catechol pathway